MLRSTDPVLALAAGAPVLLDFHAGHQAQAMEELTDAETIASARSPDRDSRSGSVAVVRDQLGRSLSTRVEV